MCSSDLAKAEEQIRVRMEAEAVARVEDWLNRRHKRKAATEDDDDEDFDDDEYDVEFEYVQ